VKSAHGDGDPRRAKRGCDIEGTRVLVRLNADEADKTEIAVAPEASEERRHIDACVGLVDRLDIDGDARPEYATLRAIKRDAVDGGELIRRDHRPPPAVHVSVVVVVRWLDKEELEATLIFHRRP
jgi:hypothetical protein